MKTKTLSKRLINWANKQKSLYHQKKLTQKQISMLEKIPDWNWDIKEK